MLVDKYYNEQGEVAVLVSSGFGAGWSTWVGGDESFLCMDKGLVELHLRGADADKVGDISKARQAKINIQVVGRISELNGYHKGQLL